MIVRYPVLVATLLTSGFAWAQAPASENPPVQSPPEDPNAEAGDPIADEAEPRVRPEAPARQELRTAKPLTAGNLEAQRYEPPDFIAEPAELPEGLRDARARSLELRDVFERVLRDNLGLQAERISVRAAALNERAAAIYEPTLTGFLRHREAVTPPLTSQEGSAGEILESSDNTWDFGLRQPLPTGGALSLDFRNNWSVSNRDTAVSPDLFRTSLELSLVQPLLRGFSTDLEVPQAEVLRAEFASERAMLQAETQSTDTVSTAERAYWDLIQALKAFEVRELSAELALRQLELTERQISAGLLPPSDEIAAQGTLARRELALVQAEERIETATDELRQLMNLPQQEWDVPLVPSESLVFVEVDENVAELYSRAIRQRPEARLAALDAERAELEEVVADNARLPVLDVGASYGLVGQEDRYTRALDQMASFRGRSWSVFVNFEWAPFGVEAAAEASRAKALHSRATIEQKRLAQDIQMQVRRAVRETRTAARQVRAAAKARRLAERSLDAEQRRFMNGLSSNFVIAQRQEELSQARLAEVSALVNHIKALVELRRATGDLLSSRGVELRLRP